MTNISIYFDGACNNHLENPPMGIGVAVFINNEYSSKFSNFIHQISTSELICSSNIAEWYACVEAMRKANSLKKIFPQSHIQIFSDSQIIAYQFNGTYDIKKTEFLPYYNKAKAFAEKVKIKFITWIPREENRRADWLSKLGIQNCENQRDILFKVKKIKSK